MVDEIVIYRTKSGFAEKYARWIADDLECECVPYGSISKEELLKYRRVVIGGYVRYEKLAAAERMSRSADFSNRANINALVEYVKAGR